MFSRAKPSLVAQMVKNPPVIQETWVLSLSWEDPLEKGKATHSSTLAWIVHGVAKSWTRLSDFHQLTKDIIMSIYNMVITSSLVGST